MFRFAFNLPWGELTEDEQDGARTLGYEAAAWPATDREWGEWDELSEERQAAAEALGLSEDCWPPPLPSALLLAWGELDGEQRAAIGSSQVIRSIWRR
jgi:hypothetical protein